MTEQFPRVLGASAARSMNVEPLFGPQVRVIKRPVVEHVEQVGQQLDALQRHATDLVQAARDEAVEIRVRAREEGRAEGLREILEQLALVHGLRDQARRDAEQEMLDLAFALAARLVGRAVERDAEMFSDIVRGQISELREASFIVVRVSPAAIAQLETDRATLAAHVNGVAVSFQPDASLTGADCIIETDRGRADARIATQLDALRDALTNAEAADD